MRIVNEDWKWSCPVKRIRAQNNHIFSPQGDELVWKKVFLSWKAT